MGKWRTATSYPNRLVRLRQVRRMKEMSQGEVGALIGKTQAHYGKIENGECGMSAEDAKVLCEFFGVSLQELLQKKPGQNSMKNGGKKGG